MTVLITDDKIVSHLRSKGLTGPIDRRFIKEYRNDLAVIAMGHAALDAGVPLIDLTRNVAPHLPAIEAHLQTIADAL